MMNLKTLKHLNKDDILHALGLAPRATATGWIAQTLGTFGVGLLVGAGLGLMLAPKPGRELRGNIRSRIRQIPEELSDTLHGLSGCTQAPATSPGNSKTV